MEEQKLKRCLSLKEAVFYGIGIILGAGIYSLIGVAAGISGNLIWISFLGAAIVSAFTVLSYAELSSMITATAAEYHYVKRGIKSELLAFLVGYMALLLTIFGSAGVALGFGGYFSTLFGQGLVVPGAIGLIIAMALINFWGIKESSRLNVIMTLIEAGGLLVIIAVALPFFGSVDYLAMPASDFMASVGLVIAGAAMIFFAFTGFEDIANMGEEIIEPEKNLPKALLIALAITTVLYLLVGIAAISVVPSDQLANSKAPMAEVANKAMPGLGGLLVLIALFSTTNTVLILSIGGARMIYGLAKDKKLPQFLARVHSTRKTPYGAIILVMLLAILFALIGEIGPVVSINNFAIFAMFFLVNASVIALRFREPNAERKFRVPFSIGKVPIIPLLGAASCIVMLWGINMDVQILHFVIPSWTIAGIAICTGIPIYYFYKGRNN